MRKFVLFFMAVFGCCVCALAQNGKVSGTVTSADGKPIAGATVVIEGSHVGTSTNADGKYTLNVRPGDVLQVSFIGMQTQRIPVNGKTTVDVTMQDDAIGLDNVVITALGITRQERTLGYASTTIKADEIAKGHAADAMTGLIGKVAGMQISSSGGTGTSQKVIVRGYSSLAGSNQPLYVIDGVPVSNSTMGTQDLNNSIDFGNQAADVNPEDIESITVLKDASSAAIYGARGAFGVILITTKSGKYNEKAEVSYNGYFSVSSPTTSTDYETRGYYSAKIADFFMMATQNTPYTSYTEADYKALWERRNDKTENPARPWVVTDRRNGRQQYVYLANFDWYNYLYDDSRPTWDHNINIKGGTKALSYMVSGRYYQQKGVNRIEPDMFKSYNFRVKLQAEIKPWLTIASNTKFFQSNYKYYGYEDEYNNFRKPTLHALASFVPVNPDGTAVSHTSMTQSSTHYLMDGYSAMMQKGKSFGNKKTQEITTTFEATFKLHKNFNVKADFSYTQGYLHNDYRSVNVQYSQYPGEVMTEPEGSFPNKYKEVVWDQNYYVADVYGTYNKTFSEKHNLTLIAGYNYEAKYYRDLTAANDGLLSEDLSDFNLAKGTTNFTLNGGRNEYAIMGWFYRAAYDYKGKYLAEVNGRYDGTSRFPRGKRYGFFPSFSAAYRISEEAFFEPLRKTVDNLKIRLSYGSLGNQQIGYYDFIQTITTKGSMGDYSFDGTILGQHATVSDPVSGNQTWEKVISKNLGADLNMFSNRLSLTADFYIRDTKGILGKGKSLPSIYGANEPQVNSNNLRTKGYELVLGWRDSFKLAGSTFSYGITGTFSDYTAEYTKCDNPSGLIGDPYVGKKYGEIWGYKVDGLFRNDEEAAEYASRVDLSKVAAGYYSATGAYGKGVRGGDIKYLDLNGDGVVDSYDVKPIGYTAIPEIVYGFGFSLQWKAFDFSAFFQGVGHVNFSTRTDQTQGFIARNSREANLFSDVYDNYWTPERLDAKYPRLFIGTNNNNNQNSSFWMANGRYMRLKNLEIGYTLPKHISQKMAMQNMRVYLSGVNLFTFSPFKLWDPDLQTGATNYPNNRIINIGLTIGF